jgi:predicted nuclease with TOPRIM domain
MTEQEQKLIADIRGKQQLLMQQNAALRTEVVGNEREIDALKQEISALKAEYAALSEKYNNLRISKALSMTDEERELAKQKISMIVREIDKCIAALNA